MRAGGRAVGSCKPVEVVSSSVSGRGRTGTGAASFFAGATIHGHNSANAARSDMSPSDRERPSQPPPPDAPPAEEGETVEETPDAPPPPARADEDDDSSVPESVRQKIETWVPDLVRKAFAAGMGAVLGTEEGIRKLTKEMPMPKD